MTRQSMTGFATLDGAQDLLSWQWEIRSVNGKGLDIRLRLADGFEALEKPVRMAAPEYVSRGNVSISLKVKQREGQGIPRVNDAVLAAVLTAVKQVNVMAEGQGIDTYPTSAADLLGLRGVMEYGAEEKVSADILAKITAQIPELFGLFQAARQSEGAALLHILTAQLDQVAALTDAAAISAEARLARSGDLLRSKVTALLDASELADEARLQQELALLAVKADITEEIDRLKAHIDAARQLLANPNPVGRKFDFLMQEFNREANTLCSKSGSAELTAIGLDLKTVIDQMREQIQNLE
ncbi:MAG: YicC family protein [Rhodobacteraceae bacterium]|nr:YicC family protein [Paracoccaceae bacterium]